MSTALVRFVPDIGDLIQLRDDDYYLGPRRWRVTGYMKAWMKPPRPDTASFGDLLEELLADSCREFDHGKGRTRLTWCHRYEAEYVTGSGVAGCCYPVERVIKVGTVSWSKAQIEQARIRSYYHIGDVLF